MQLEHVNKNIKMCYAAASGQNQFLHTILTCKPKGYFLEQSRKLWVKGQWETAGLNLFPQSQGIAKASTNDT